MRKRWFLIAIIFFVVPWLMAGCGVAQEEYDRAKSTLATTQASLEQATSDLTAAQSSMEQTKVTLAEREASIGRLESRVNQLEKDLSSAEDEWNKLYSEYYELNSQYIEMEAMAQELLSELDAALTVPYTAISGREITWAFRLLDNSTQKWTLGVDTYRYWIERREPTDTVTLDTESGPVVLADFTKYVYPKSFEDVVTSLYERSGDEWEYAKEAFNIVSQLTVYSEDIGEDPRWPLETFTEGGGDCEDLAILYATLLKAAPYPYEVELVYMDSDNPTDPEDVNHVIVSVAAPAEDWLALSECTIEDGFLHWERVVGWYYDL